MCMLDKFQRWWTVGNVEIVVGNFNERLSTLTNVDDGGTVQVDKEKVTGKVK